MRTYLILSCPATMDVSKYDSPYGTPPCVNHSCKLSELGSPSSCPEVITVSDDGIREEPKKQLVRVTPNVKSLEETINEQKQEIERLQRAHSKNTVTKRQWTTFFTQATNLSKKKKRKLNAVKRKGKKEKKDVEECILRYWEQLYWDRNKSDKDFQRYHNTPVPEWLESRNFVVGASHEVLRKADLKYDGSDFRRYKSI